MPVFTTCYISFSSKYPTELLLCHGQNLCVEAKCAANELLLPAPSPEEGGAFPARALDTPATTKQ